MHLAGSCCMGFRPWRHKFESEIHPLEGMARLSRHLAIPLAPFIITKALILILSLIRLQFLPDLLLLVNS